MRTKALLGLAVLAAGAFTASAQIYSQNVVGYINVPIQPGFNLLTCQLKSGSNGADVMLPATDSSQVLKWTGVGFDTWFYDSGFGGWIDSSFNPSIPTVPTGAGFFYFNPNGAGSLTLVGEVDGTPGTPVTQPVASGFQAVGSKLPYSGAVDAAASFNLPVQDSMQVLKWNGVGYTTWFYDSGFGGWIDDGFNPVSAPTMNLGQGFFYFNPGPSVNWTQPF